MNNASAPLPTRGSWIPIHKSGQTCPVCQHKDNCSITDDGNMAYCRRAEKYSPPPGWIFVKFGSDGGAVFRTEQFNQNKQEVFGPEYWERKRREQEARQKNTTLVQGRKKEKAVLTSEAQRAAAISWLISRLTLSEEHQAYLLKEGFELQRALELGYRTLPGEKETRQMILKELDAEFGREVTRRLGFVYERAAKAGNYHLEFAGVVKEVSALLFPIRNLEGQPVALKARWLNSKEIDPKTGQQKREYRLMSAGSTELGASVGTPAHIARPFWNNPALKENIVVVEGERKADYLADILGLPVIGVLGVNNWQAGGLLQKLATLKRTIVIEAFDADRVNNPNVERAARQMCLQIAGAGYKVFQARWPLTLGKGPDDFWRNWSHEETWELHRFKPAKKENNAESESGQRDRQTDEEYKRRYGINRQRAERIADEFAILDKETMDNLVSGSHKGPAAQFFQKNEGRAKLTAIIRGAIANHSQGNGPRRIIAEMTTGLGKTQAATESNLEHLNWQRPGRILYATENKKLFAALIEPGGPYYEWIQTGQVAVLEGRSPDPDSPFYCMLYEDCQRVGDKRGIAIDDACSTCPLFSIKNYRKYAAQHGLDPNLENPPSCKYLKAVEATRDATLVVAPQDSVIHDGDQILRYDHIEFDEITPTKLIEQEVLTVQDIEQWSNHRRRIEGEARTQHARKMTLEWIPMADAQADAKAKDAAESAFQDYYQGMSYKHRIFDKFFDLVKTTIIEYHAASSEEGRAKLLDVLLARAEAERIDLKRLVTKVAEWKPGGKHNRYLWEKPYRNSKGELIVPLRLAADFISILYQELDNEDPEADTKIWIERKRDNEGKLQAGIICYIPRQKVIDVLQGEYQGEYKNELGGPPTVLILDATAGNILKLALPKFEVVKIQVEQPLYIIQVTDSLFTPASLSRPRTMERVNQSIAALAAKYQAKNVAVFSRKQFNPDPEFASPGDKDCPKLNVILPNEEGTVRYGHFERHNKGLNDYKGADLIASVGHYCPPIDEIEAQVRAFRCRKTGFSSDEKNGNYTLKRYDWQAEDGKGLARWSKTHYDPDVQAAIDHAVKANILQTIGRGRALDRPADNPMVVVIYSKMTIPGLPQNEITTTTDILGESRISERQRAALEAGRTNHNVQSHMEAIEKIEQTKKELASEGREWVAPTSFAKRAGVSRSTLHRLGYGWKGRWIAVKEIPALFPLDMFISNISHPEKTRPEKKAQEDVIRKVIPPAIRPRIVLSSVLRC